MDEMRDRIVAAAKHYRARCGQFVRELVAQPSLSRQEEHVAVMVRREMLKLGYVHVDIDRFGNVIGKLGEGRTKIIFDAHLDTVGIGDRSSWRFDPFQGDFKAGKVYGHGAVNNKGGLAAIVYAGAIMRELDLLNDCTVYIVGSVQTEECEGLAYKALFDVEKLYPHFVVLSMPTGMRIARGQRGRAEFRITLRGQPVHASTPTEGFNSIYGMAHIIEQIRQLNDKLPTDPLLGKASVAVTHMEAEYNGSNMLPESSHIIVDRRMVPGENAKKVFAQLKYACKGTRAKVEVVEYDQASYRGLRLPMEKYFPSWTLEEEHPLIEAAERAYKSVFKKKATLDMYTMSSSGAYTMGIAKVPTIGVGPGEERFANPTNDHIRLDDLEKCMAFYASLPESLPNTEPIRLPRRRR